MPDLERFHNHLSINHVNRSQTRDQIFETIRTIGPISRAQIIAALREQASQAAIYANLKTLLKIGVVEEIRPKLFELTDRFKPHHHYFWCRACGRHLYFYDKALEKSLDRLAARRRVALEEHRIELSGLCALCQASHTPRTAIGTSLRRRPGR